MCSLLTESVRRFFHLIIFGATLDLHLRASYWNFYCSCVIYDDEGEVTRNAQTHDKKETELRIYIFMSIF